MKDIRSIDRGKCLNCHECEEFTGTLRCDYCDCVAAKHIRKQEEEAITGDESNKHFKLDTLEHSGHSDVGLTSLTSGFENLEENCVEEVSNVNDSIFHDGISRLESLISELEKEENEKFNVSCKFKVVEEDGKSMFSCSLCNKNYKLGDFGKKIQNVKFHASSRGDLANVYAVGQILSDSDEYCDDDDLDPCIATDETQEIHDSSDDSQDENSTYTPMNIFEPTSSEFMEMHECIDVAIDNFEEHSDQNSVNIDDSIPSSLQKRQGLCCKMAREYDIFMESEKRWFCHVDDDNYVNVPALVGFLQQYNHSDNWYLGRPSISHPMEVLDRADPGQKLAFWFATGGAGFCISRGLADKMVPHAGGGRIMTTGDIIRLPDDCTVGYIINHLLKVPLTKIKEFHSHLEGLHRIPQHQLSDQLTLSYFNSNVIDVKGYSHENDPTRFKTVHCHLYPYLSQCVDMPRW